MESYRDLTVKCKRGKSIENMNCPHKYDCADIEACLAEDHYKAVSSREGNPQYANINKYTKDVWKVLTCANTLKMNYLVNDEYCMPETIVSQSLVFDMQMAKHINNDCPNVAVLSSFPLYVLDYYGAQTLKEKLGIQGDDDGSSFPTFQCKGGK